MDLKTKMMISIIVPCLNEEEVLPLFYQALEALLPDLETEIEYVFVDDGSSDGTLELLKAYREQNPAVHYISFSRNFGKEAALYAGLQYATGDLVVVMDADLQDPPSMLFEMKNVLDKNVDLDCVGTRRTLLSQFLCCSLLSPHAKNQPSSSAVGCP
ncbi:glycosil transferase [Streptococcus pneumoniae]|nr:glycosil transferase [Streptococcus pneumoniae]CKB77491.1 glycosil transferase [Streptococcus pneumoniae]CKB93788.1 glycosil transferase [Streptococcus pneumoniae]